MYTIHSFARIAKRAFFIGVLFSVLVSISYPKVSFAVQGSSCSLTPNHVYRSPSASTVYYITDDCKKRPIFNPDVYFSHFESWKDVAFLESWEINQIPDHPLRFLPWGPRRVFGNHSLLKTTDDSRVYLILNGKAYPIESEEAFNAFGFAFNQVEDVVPEVFSAFTKVSTTLKGIDDAPFSIVFKYPDSPEVYVLAEEGGRMVKRHVQTMTELNALVRSDRIAIFPKTKTFENANGGSVVSTPPADTVAPVLSVVSFSVAETTATITWVTNESASSVVDYGATNSYGMTKSVSGRHMTHSVLLTGLSSGTMYHFRVSSQDEAGNTGYSSDYTFTTTAVQSTPSNNTTLSLGANASLNGFLPFGSANEWNKDISNAPLDPKSKDITEAAGFTGLHLHHDFWDDPNYGIPYMIVDSTVTPFVPVHITEYGDESDIMYFPIPADAPIEGNPSSCNISGDNHLLILDRATMWLYEMGHARYCNGEWYGGAGTIWDLLDQNERPFGWTSADAAGLPIFAGLIRYDEVEAGEIKHAIRFTMKQTKDNSGLGYFVSPARHSAGNNWGTQNIMGMRIRLKADFDISGFSRDNQVILTAMKKYGMILADNGGSFYFQGTPDPRWNGDDLNALDAVSSDNFEVVQMSPSWPGQDTTDLPTGPRPTISSFTASAQTVSSGQAVTLSWSTTNESYNFIDVVGPQRGNSVTVHPTQTTTYTLVSTNSYGRTTRSVTVTVQ